MHSERPVLQAADYRDSCIVHRGTVACGASFEGNCRPARGCVARLYCGQYRVCFYGRREQTPPVCKAVLPNPNPNGIPLAEKADAARRLASVRRANADRGRFTAADFHEARVDGG